MRPPEPIDPAPQTVPRDVVREPVGVILAGGQGMRMGGLEKADLMLGDRPLLAHVRERLEPQVAALAINTNKSVSSDLALISDATRENLGPLAGVLAGLDWATAQGASHVVTAAVDTPFFPCDLVPHLLMAAQSHPHGLAVAATADGLHGTFGIWPVSLRGELARFLKDGHRKVRSFTQTHDAATATFPDTTPPPFFNINTPDDLEQARSWV